MTYIDPNFVPEKPSIQHYLCEYSFPQLAEVSHPVIDWAGIIWAGPTRRGMNAPNAVDLWRAWQKDVQKAWERPGVVTPEVMDYFQRTKGFSRPPKNGEIDLQGQEITVAQPKFTWSPTKLQAFDTCPYQYAAKYFYNSLPYEETEATKWGNRVHKAAEDYLKGGMPYDPEAFEQVAKWVKVIEKIPGERFVEEKISVDERLMPCDYESGEGRMIADVYVLNGENLFIADWKTGKVKDDHFQLKVYALLLALKHPQVKKITYKYIWTKTGQVTGGELVKQDLVEIAKELKAKLSLVKQAWEHENYPQRPSGLCKNWCGVTDCPHCGGGR